MQTNYAILNSINTPKKTDVYGLFIKAYKLVSTNLMMIPKFKENIENYSSKLTKILNQEVKLGNEIIEISKGWPDEKTIIIFLKKPFIAEYRLENVEYMNVDDPHYWKAEYVDHSTKHVLACKF